MAWGAKGASCRKMSIALADSVRGIPDAQPTWGVTYVRREDVINSVVTVLKVTYGSRFNEERFRNYLAGTHGPNGGKLKHEHRDTGS